MDIGGGGLAVDRNPSQRLPRLGLSRYGDIELSAPPHQLSKRGNFFAIPSSGDYLSVICTFTYQTTQLASLDKRSIDFFDIFHPMNICVNWVEKTLLKVN